MVNAQIGTEVMVCMTGGTDKHGRPLAGQYRPGVVSTATNGTGDQFQGSIVSGDVQPDPQDVGGDLTFVDATFAAPTANGSSSAGTLPTGTPGTWCDRTTYAQKIGA